MTKRDQARLEQTIIKTRRRTSTNEKGEPFQTRRTLSLEFFPFSSRFFPPSSSYSTSSKFVSNFLPARTAAAAAAAAAPPRHLLPPQSSLGRTPPRRAVLATGKSLQVHTHRRVGKKKNQRKQSGTPKQQQKAHRPHSCLSPFASPSFPYGKSFFLFFVCFFLFLPLTPKRSLQAVIPRGRVQPFPSEFIICFSLSLSLLLW